jgi:purine-binding chemotaxis protein CheW
MTYTRKNSGAKARKLTAVCISDQSSRVSRLSRQEFRGGGLDNTRALAVGDIMGVINLCRVVLPNIDRVSTLRSMPVDVLSSMLTVTCDIVRPMPEVSSDLLRQCARGLLVIDKWMICFIEWAGILPKSESKTA